MQRHILTIGALIIMLFSEASLPSYAIDYIELTSPRCRLAKQSRRI